MTELTKGQRVHVEFDGVITSRDGIFVYDVRSHDGADMAINSAYITPLDPGNWPPQVGDIWEADGEEFIAEANASEHAYVVIEPINRFSDVGPFWERMGGANGPTLDSFKSLSPTLIRRRGQ